MHDTGAAAEIQHAVAESAAMATSPDGMVTVTVGPGGALTALYLGRRAIARHGGSLGAVLLDTIRAAVRSAGAADAVTDEPRPAVDDALLRDAPESVRLAAADAERRLARYRDTIWQLGGLRVTTRSPGGEVEVTVRAGGVVCDLTIGELSPQRDPAELAALVLATVHSATTEAARQLGAQVQELRGPLPAVPAQPAAAHRDW
jgi:hypothetical protein